MGAVATTLTDVVVTVLVSIHEEIDLVGEVTVKTVGGVVMVVVEVEVAMVGTVAVEAAMAAVVAISPHPPYLTFLQMAANSSSRMLQ